VSGLTSSASVPDSPTGPAPALEVEHLRKVFPARAGAAGNASTSQRARRVLARPSAGAGGTVAVDDVSFAVAPGRSLAIVGESGSGKTTVARMIVGLERPTAGRIAVGGRERSWRRVSSRERLRRGREAQIVFQDPYSSLDPRQTVRRCLDEALRLHFDWEAERRRERVEGLLEQVGLDHRHGDALPRALSGGQRQRVAIARALACEPSVLICDEAVASLDVSIQAQVLNLLSDIRDETGVTYLFISHDLAVVRQVSDDVIVMRRGRVVESGPTAAVLGDPQHPYTQRLLAAIPRRGWRPSARDELAAESPSPAPPAVSNAHT
jgi:peptide/nickel transport system ATP-binding protein